MEEVARKKLKLGLSERTNRAEESPEGEDRVDKCKGGKTSKFSLDASLEEDEGLLEDSGIDLQWRKEPGSAGGSGREGPPPLLEKAEGETNASRHSLSRGETPEGSEGSFQPEREDAAKRTPDKSLFRKVQEKLMYECSLTPKKVKKKCLELKMDL